MSMTEKWNICAYCFKVDTSIRKYVISANETTLHTSHNFYKVTVKGQNTAVNTKPVLTPNSKQYRVPKRTSVKPTKPGNKRHFLHFWLLSKVVAEP